MSTPTPQAAVPSTRRDRRFELGPGCFAEFHDSHGARVRGRLTRISASGVSCEVPGQPADFRVDQVLSAAVLGIRQCRLQGDVVVKNVRSTRHQDRVEIGGLFLPASQAVVDRLMAVLAGIEAVVPDGTAPPDGHQQAPSSQ